MPANGMDSLLFYQPPISIMRPVIERSFNMERTLSLTFPSRVLSRRVTRRSRFSPRHDTIPHRRQQMFYEKLIFFHRNHEEIK